MDLHIYKMLKVLVRGTYLREPLEINKKLVDYGKKYFILMERSFWVLDRRVYLNITNGFGIKALVIEIKKLDKNKMIINTEKIFYIFVIIILSECIRLFLLTTMIDTVINELKMLYIEKLLLEDNTIFYIEILKKIVDIYYK